MVRRLAGGLVVERAEHHQGAKPLAVRERIVVHDRRDGHAGDLARRHDRGEEERAKVLDAVVDDDLPDHGAHRERECIALQRRILYRELERWLQLSGCNETYRCATDHAMHMRESERGIHTRPTPRRGSYRQR